MQRQIRLTRQTFDDTVQGEDPTLITTKVVDYG
jgi:hypothetical protein